MKRKIGFSFHFSHLFRNSGFAQITFRPEMKRKIRFSFHFSHLFRNFAAILRSNQSKKGPLWQK